MRVIESVATGALAQLWTDELPAAGETVRRWLAKNAVPERIETLECESCGLQFFPPSPPLNAEWYESVERYGPRWEYGEALVDLPKQPSRVLEVGCGEGWFLQELAAAGHIGVGIDFNQIAVRAARAKGFDARVGDLRAINNGDDADFDAVAFFHVIEHLDDAGEFFESLSKVMKLGSTLHFSCPGPNRFTTALFPDQRLGLRDKWDYPPLHHARWCETAAEALLSRTGWRLHRYAEEPFRWRGVATSVALRRTNLFKSGRFHRRAAIAAEMIRVMPARFRYRGMSMYCAAIRVCNGAASGDLSQSAVH